jgi:acetyl-CoA carboxylase biotin carboxyl carrier protein
VYPSPRYQVAVTENRHESRTRERPDTEYGDGHDKEEVIMATPVTVPMVGKIVSVTVKVGDQVKEDDQVAILEAMKMEMPLVAPVSGVIKEIYVSAGQEVEAEATIAMIE